MASPVKAKWIVQPPGSDALRYGIALVSVAAALGLTDIFLYFGLPQPFTAFALSAIAITFWYGGTMPGILATVLPLLVRSYFFEPEINAASRALYDLVFLIFALLMTQVARARNELAVRVAERTSELTQANQSLRLEIAERKHAENSLQHSETYLTEAQRLSHTGSFGWKPSTGEITWSDETFRIFQYDRATKPTAEIVLQRIHPEDAASVKETIERASKDGRDFENEYRLVMPDGSVKHVHVVGHAETDELGELEFVGAVMDVTGRKRADEMLRRSEAYLAEAQRLTHMGSWACNILTGELIHSSEEHSRLYGFDPERGTPSFEEFVQRIHPEDRARVIEAFQSASRAGKDFDAYFRVVFPNATTKYVYGTGHPVFNTSGGVGEFVGIVMDVTERRRTDEERERFRQVQAELAHVNRVTTMGELTASLAHEVNQPISAAITDAKTCWRWLMRDQPDIEEARAAALRIVSDGERAAEIVSRIRRLFKKGTPQQEPVDVNEIIREMIVLLRGEATRYSVSVRTELAADLPETVGDRVQLQQVLLNLIMNGIDAMKTADETRELLVKSQRAGKEHLLITVSDTGVGLPPEQADQIFNAFFTTKLNGTGMGLRISRSIVESHGGRLWAGSNSPRGASFHFTLPTRGT
jgi:signal transduction histidine kinase